VGAVVNECDEVLVAVVRGSRKWTTNVCVYAAENMFSMCRRHLTDHLSGLFSFEARHAWAGGCFPVRNGHTGHKALICHASDGVGMEVA